MDIRGGGERHGSIGSEEEGTFSKRHTLFEEYENGGVDRMANKSTRLEAEEQWVEMETTSGSEYWPKGSGSKDSGSGSKSVDTELEFSNECVRIKDR